MYHYDVKSVILMSLLNQVADLRSDISRQMEFAHCKLQFLSFLYENSRFFAFAKCVWRNNREEGDSVGNKMK